MGFENFARYADDWARKDMQISGIYMSKERTNGYSWALTMKQYSSKKTVLLSTFEKCPTTYRKPGIFRLQPDPDASTAQCLLCCAEKSPRRNVLDAEQVIVPLYVKSLIGLSTRKFALQLLDNLEDLMFGVVQTAKLQ